MIYGKKNKTVSFLVYYYSIPDPVTECSSLKQARNWVNQEIKCSVRNCNMRKTDFKIVKITEEEFKV